MKIAIVGAGAMGGLFGARLSAHNDVVMIDAWEEVVRSVNERGLTVQELDESERAYLERVSAFASGAYDGPCDLVIMFVKSTTLEGALEQNRALFRPETVVLSLQNGAGNDRKIARYVDEKNVVIGTTKHNALNAGPGVVRHTGTGVTTIGSNHGRADLLARLRETFEECGIETEVSDDIQRVIWSKLFVNLSINTFTAITQTPIGYMLKNADAWNFAKRLVYEAVEVAEEDGTYFDRREALSYVRQVCEDSEWGYSSMYQDRMHGRKTEIDAINGAIVEQAKLYGVPVPYNSLIVDLVHAIEGSYELERPQRELISG